MQRQLLPALLVVAVLGGLPACGHPDQPPAPTPTPLAEELVFYNWPDYMPQAALDDFEAAYGVRVNYVTYQSQEEAAARISAGQVDFDVAVIEYEMLPHLVERDLLARIDYRQVPNFKHIAADFRDLAFDPGNQYLAPYNWGTTGLLVRGDLVAEPVTRWADLWDERYAGQVAVRSHQLELIAVALKSLGYSANSEDPGQLEAAQERLLRLRPSLFFVDVESPSATAQLLDGAAVLMVGWPGDALYAQGHNPAISYVLPEEGSMLWGDGFVISAKSTRKHTAEVFINYVLRPEVSAQIVEQYYYATANEAALALIDPDIRDNPTIFPPRADIRKAEWYLPLSPEGQRLRDQVWQRFLSATPQEER